MSDVDKVDSADQPHQSCGHGGHSCGHGGEFLVQWVQRAWVGLRNAEEDINQLNVFPIPDADTGTNMVTTLGAAVAQANREKSSGWVEISAALAAGAVHSARGNSGMALSQILRAVAVTSATQSWDAHAVASCLRLAVSFVRQAIADPAPGTIVSVLEAAAEAAVSADNTSAADSDAQIRTSNQQEETVPLSSVLKVVEKALAASRLALADTTCTLEALQRAGVVDAGGYGFVVILEALYTELRAAAGDLTDSDAESLVPSLDTSLREQTVKADSLPEQKAPSGLTEGSSLLEIMCTVRGEVDRITPTLEALGTSVVIAPCAQDSFRIHIHTDRPGEVLDAAYREMQVKELRIEALPPSQHVLLAVVPPGALSQVFHDAGALLVRPGKDAPQRITEILRTVDAEVLLQSNGLLSRLQLHGICAAHPRLRVLPTTCLVAGIAAQAVFDPHQPLNLVALSMADAAANMVTATIDASQDGYVLHSAGAADHHFAHLQNAVDCAKRRLSVMRSVPSELLTVVVSPEVSEPLDFTYPDGKDGVGDGTDIIMYTSDNGGHCVQIGVE